MKEEISALIRKTRAQTLWDAFAREMTPIATKLLSKVNPNSIPVDPVARTYPRGCVSLASSTLDHRQESKWGFNQQLDFIIRILQDGLFCLNPSLAKALPDENFASLTNRLQTISPFVLNDSAYDKIDQIVPAEFSVDLDRFDKKGDKTRLYKLARILFFLRSYENPEENEFSFAKFFCKEVDKVLLGIFTSSIEIPKTKESQQEVFLRINKHFDNTLIEKNFLRAIQKFCPRSARQINFTKKTVPFKKYPTAKSDDATFIEDTRHLNILNKLELELSEGHYSLVGGRDYTRMRFPESILKRVSAGLIPVIIIDGTLEESIDYLKSYYLNGATDVLQFQICGQYGDFSKVYFRYKLQDKTHQLFLIAQRGQSRVLSNAASLLLYYPKHTDLNEQTRIRSSQITCVYRREPLNEILKDEINSILESISEELSILGNDYSNIQTELMPATSADTLVQSLKNLNVIEQWTDHRFETSGRVSVIIIRNPKNNSLKRIIIPSVGGSGLYGDTAGTFVYEYLKILDQKKYPTNLLNFSSNIKFFATAGAIISKEFTPHEGSVCTPLNDFISYDLTKKVSAKKVKVSGGSIHTYNNHGWAACPAIETSKLFDTILGEKSINLGMIDVEGLPIAEVINYKFENIHPTFTPIYYVSDLIKPKSDKFDPNQPDFDSYAYGCRAGMAIELSKSQLEDLIEYIFA